MSLKELGKRVGLKESSVSQTAGRISKLRQKNKEWGMALIKIEQGRIHNS
jgi:hypothetical protein